MTIVLICGAIELGGRKGAQVVTRQAIWKRFENVWYYVLGVPVLLVTVGLFWLSFDLSTKGVNKTFTNSVQVAKNFDDTYLIQRYDQNANKINSKFDKQISTLTTAYTSNFVAKESEYNSKIQAVQNKIDLHIRNIKNGVKWATSHKDKQIDIRDNIVIQRQSVLNELTTSHNSKIATIEQSRANELSEASRTHQNTINEAKKVFNDNHQADKDNAIFWGSLFSNLVGIMIVIALVCIVIVEVFRKGAQIEISYKESDLPPSLLQVSCKGLINRIYNVSYSLTKIIYVERKEFTLQVAPLPYQDDVTDQKRKQKRNLKKLFGIDVDDTDIYDFKDFSKNKKSNKNITATVEIDPTSSEGLEVRANSVLDDLSSDGKKIVVSGQIVGEKNCIYCGKTFQYKNKKKRFCNTNCRQSHWESVNKKKLKKGRVKDK